MPLIRCTNIWVRWFSNVHIALWGSPNLSKPYAMHLTYMTPKAVVQRMPYTSLATQKSSTTNPPPCYWLDEVASHVIAIVLHIFTRFACNFPSLSCVVSIVSARKRRGKLSQSHCRRFRKLRYHRVCLRNIVSDNDAKARCVCPRALVREATGW